MNKKLLSFGVASVVLVLSSGCAMNQPKIVDHNTTITRNVLVPHSDNVKKAVVILIDKSKNIESKIQKIENSLKDNSVKVKSVKSSENNTTIILSKKDEQISQNANNIKMLREDIRSLSERLSDMQKSIKKLLNNHKTLLKQNTNKPVADTQYNAIIKDFVGDDLK